MLSIFFALFTLFHTTALMANGGIAHMVFLTTYNIGQLFSIPYSMMDLFLWLIFMFVLGTITLIEYGIIKRMLSITNTARLLLATICANLISTIAGIAPGIWLLTHKFERFNPLIQSPWGIAGIFLVFNIAIELPVLWVFFRKIKLGKLLRAVICANFITVGCMLLIELIPSIQRHTTQIDISQEKKYASSLKKHGHNTPESPQD